MNSIINQQMEIIWSEFEENDVDDKLAAFQRLKDVASSEDLPQLLTLLKSKRNGFWERELLSEQICEHGGATYLPELFDALEQNEVEGHDNDTFNHFLTEIAWADSQGCERKLQEMLSEQGFKHKEKAEWLLTFCE